MKRYITNTLIVAIVLGLFTTVGCIRKPPVEVPDAEKELDHLVIMEAFYIGNLGETVDKRGKSGYWHDDSASYIKIYNPTKETKYLDGLGLATSSFVATDGVIFDVEEENFTKEYTAVHKVVHFPGTGKDYPILPGETKLISNVACNHATPYFDVELEEEMPGNPHSLDLSNADFEWLTLDDIERGASNGRTDNPDVPNFTKSFMLEGANEKYFKIGANRALMLIDFPKENFEGENINKLWRKYETTWVSSEGTTIPNIEVWDLVIPNTSIIDAVVICPYESYAFNPVDPSIDEGWQGVVPTDISLSTLAQRKSYRVYLNKAIRRIHDGKKWVDTNNSLIDFDIVEASNNKDYSQPPASTTPDEPAE